MKTCKECDAGKELYRRIGYRFCKLKIFYCARHKKLTEPTGRCEFWKRRTLKYDLSAQRFDEAEANVRKAVACYRNMNKRLPRNR